MASTVTRARDRPHEVGLAGTGRHRDHPPGLPGVGGLQRAGRRISPISADDHRDGERQLPRDARERV
ncbi:MAG: hypothetical protein DLM64_05650 [Solirubrobacterales bacterium]|nr:MAG: hypothetical protein DLM64_05650 [Solirubrobacterales bacterium]